MDYEQLTAADKAQIVRTSLLEVETEHYTLTLRLAAYQDARDVEEEAKREMIAQTRNRLASLEAAIAVYRRELEDLA
ncbi:MAG: hypothetical protein M3320_06105 [Actinomycetota bacterium]|nr:hypothetical protein [Actinomycetota bacterium]